MQKLVRAPCQHSLPFPSRRRRPCPRPARSQKLNRGHGITVSSARFRFEKASVLLKLECFTSNSSPSTKSRSFIGQDDRRQKSDFQAFFLPCEQTDVRPISSALPGLASGGYRSASILLSPAPAPLASLPHLRTVAFPSQLPTR